MNGFLPPPTSPPPAPAEIETLRSTSPVLHAALVAAPTNMAVDLNGARDALRGMPASRLNAIKNAAPAQFDRIVNSR